MFDKQPSWASPPQHGDIPHDGLAAMAAVALDTPPALSRLPPRAGRPRSRLGAAGRLVERWVPDALGKSHRSGRRRWPVLAVAAAVVVIVVAVMLFAGGGSDPERPPPLPVAAGAPPGQSARAGEPPPKTDLVVSVVGKVGSPGVVTLPAGARVADAVRAAGGAFADVDPASVNLARKLIDGEQLHIGVPAPPAAQGPPGGPAQPGPAGTPGKVSLNMASPEQLDALPGVGAVTAKRIVDWRTQHGGFTSVEQLREVDGIGQAKFGRLRDLVTVP